MRFMDALLLFSLPRVNGLVMGKNTNLIVECGIANWELFNYLGQVLRELKATCQLLICETPLMKKKK